MKKLAVMLFALSLLGGNCNPPNPDPPVPPQPEAVVVAYLSGNIGPEPGRVIVRRTLDGVSYEDRGAPDRLRRTDGQPRGVAVAVDATGTGTLAMWGLGPTRLRVRYALGTLWESDFIEQSVPNVADLLAPSLTPFGTDGAAWLVAAAARAPGSAEGAARFPAFWVQNASGSAGGPAPTKTLRPPFGAEQAIDARPVVFARGASKVLFAQADQPKPAAPGSIRVVAGSVDVGARDVRWDSVPTPIRASEGDFAQHRVADLCLTGDGATKFWLGVLLLRLDESGIPVPGAPAALRLYRTADGRVFERVRFRFDDFEREFILEQRLPRALACALLPGRTDVLIGTVGSVEGESVRTMHRVRAGGDVTTVPESDPESGPFPVAPLELPFAMVASGGG